MIGEEAAERDEVVRRVAGKALRSLRPLEDLAGHGERMLAEEIGDERDRLHVVGRGVNSQAGRLSTRAVTRSGRVTASRKAMAAPIEMPPATARPSASRSASAATSLVKVAIDSSVSDPDSDAPWARHSSVIRRDGGTDGKHLGHLGRVAAEPVLEDDRRPLAPVLVAKRNAVAVEVAKLMPAPRSRPAPGGGTPPPPVPPPRSAHG